MIIQVKVAWADNTAQLAQNIKSGTDQITAMKTSADRLANSLGGDGLFKQANTLVAAISQLGDTTKLTAAEQDRASATLDNAIAKYKAMGLEAPTAMRALADEMRNTQPPATALQGVFNDLGSSLQSTVVGFVSAQAILGLVTRAWDDLVGLVNRSVKAFSTSEDAQEKLIAALKQHSLATPAVIDQYNQLATSFQQTTKYADEQINAMEALLTQVGGLMPSAMAGALEASTNLAAGLGIDLQSATMLVAKAAAGHTETLGRYGIVVSDAALQTKGFDAVLDAINRQFGGQAAAAINTYSGQIAQVSNAWNNVQEAIGKFIVLNPLVVQAMNRIKDAAADADKNSEGASHSVLDWAVTLRLLDPASAEAVGAIEDYVDGLNTVEAAQRRLASMPSPFAQTTKDMQLPAITSGMALFNQEVADHKAELEAAAEAAKKFDAAWTDLNSVGEDFAATAATINPELRNQIDYYLQAGVSVEKLAAAYPQLTEAQIAAEGKVREAAKSASSEVNQLWSQFDDLVTQGGSAFDKQVASIDKWAAELETKMEEAGKATPAFYEALTAVWNAKLKNLSDSTTSALSKAGQALAVTSTAFDKLNDSILGLPTENLAAWNHQVMDMGTAVAGGYVQFNNLADAIDAFNAGLDASKVKVSGLSGEVTSLANAIKMLDAGGSITYDLSTDEGLAYFQSMNPGASISWSNAQIEAFVQKGGTVQQLEQMGVIDVYAGLKGSFANGVTDFSGGLALVGENGPEVVDLPAGSNVYPNGMGPAARSVTVNMNVSGVWDARSKRELTDVVNIGLGRLVGKT